MFVLTLNASNPNSLPHHPDFKGPLKRSILKTLWENGKGENTAYQHFLPFSQCFIGFFLGKCGKGL